MFLTKWNTAVIVNFQLAVCMFCIVSKMSNFFIVLCIRTCIISLSLFAVSTSVQR